MRGDRDLSAEDGHSIDRRHTSSGRWRVNRLYRCRNTGSAVSRGLTGRWNRVAGLSARERLTGRVPRPRPPVGGHAGEYLAGARRRTHLFWGVGPSPNPS